MSDIIFFKGVKRVHFSIGHVLEVMMKYVIAVGNCSSSDICKRTCEELQVPWTSKSRNAMKNLYHRRVKVNLQEKMSLENSVINDSVATVRNSSLIA